MPRKRKTSVSTDVTHVEIKPTPDHLEMSVTHTSRRVCDDTENLSRNTPGWKGQQSQSKGEIITTKTKRQIQGQGIGLLGPKESSGLEEESEDLEDKTAMARKGVQNAIADLARMERRLTRATKRQKAKVESSDFAVVRKDFQEEAAMKPDDTEFANPVSTSISGRPAAAAANDHLPTPDRESVGSEVDKEMGRIIDEHMNDPIVGCIEVNDRGPARPPPVHSGYLPLPWTGRLGYACLNTYLRAANPTVFCSRTCRMSSIIDHQHPLQDPSLPEHPTQNIPDMTAEADEALGLQYVQKIGLANAGDIVKMLCWNEKYGIKFMRLSSEMFPFASHEKYGYKLAPFASEVLARAGAMAAQFGHRVTMHPGQFTQLASPRNEVIRAAVRDLEYHDELLTLLRLPEQQNKDAVLILHMGGVYGDKEATLGRFRENYTTLLSPSIQARLVLENDDVSWSVHDLLPICEELNIPLVLDYHHHNIIFDSSQVREGTLDVSQPELMDRIAATWKRKGIKQKMHYSEPCIGAVTPRDRRKHSPRVATLPPCPPDMDLMIEAKDKEQAVFALMRNFKLPGYEKINDMIPYVREDENRPSLLAAAKARRKKAEAGKKRKRGRSGGEAEEETDMPEEMGEEDTPPGEANISYEDFAMGGLQNRVHWPQGMEEWLKPMKRLLQKGDQSKE